jgi:hypothetical protein
MHHYTKHAYGMQRVFSEYGFGSRIRACSYSVHILFIHSSIFNKSLDMIDLYNQTIENNKDVSRYWFTNNFFITCQVREYLASSLLWGSFFCGALPDA